MYMYIHTGMRLDLQFFIAYTPQGHKTTSLFLRESNKVPRS